jgi:hypothetical protein
MKKYTLPKSSSNWLLHSQIVCLSFRGWLRYLPQIRAKKIYENLFQIYNTCNFHPNIFTNKELIKTKNFSNLFGIDNQTKSTKSTDLVKDVYYVIQLSSKPLITSTFHRRWYLPLLVQLHSYSEKDLLLFVACMWSIIWEKRLLRYCLLRYRAKHGNFDCPLSTVIVLPREPTFVSRTRGTEHCKNNSIAAWIR